MKKVIVLLAVLSLFAVSAFAADSVTKNVEKSMKKAEKAISGDGVEWAQGTNLITANPLGLIFGLWNARYEMALGDSNGLGFGINYWGLTFGDWKYSIIGGQVDYNWYFQKHALNGWFAGPNLGIQMATINYKYTTLDSSFNTVTKDESASAVFVGVGGHGGYRWIWDGGFTLDVIASLTYNAGSAVTINGTTASGFGGIGFGLGCDLGYAW